MNPIIIWYLRANMEGLPTNTHNLSCRDKDCLESPLWTDTILDFIKNDMDAIDIQCNNEREKYVYCFKVSVDMLNDNIGEMKEYKVGRFSTSEIWLVDVHGPRIIYTAGDMTLTDVLKGGNINYQK